MAMSLEPKIRILKADGVISKGKAVKYGSDNLHVAQATATTDKIIGIAQGDAAAAEDLVEVAMPSGGAKALAKTTIAAGDLLGCNADGSLQKVANANDRIIAIAEVDAAAGDIFGVQVVMAQATAAQA